MRAQTLRTGRALAVLGLCTALCACGDGGDDLGRSDVPPPMLQAAKRPAAAAAPGPGAAVESNLNLPPLRDQDFVESELNRDPFRNFSIELKGKHPLVAQRTVLMPTTPLKAMRLIAIITGIDQPRAMIVDERGVGHVTTRGDFVGVADVVHTGGAENLPVALNWRVERIRENEVVLAREDPSGPNRPPLTQVIPLHPEGEPESQANAMPHNEG
jgi:type IV pilus assembly protein PilP